MSEVIGGIEVYNSINDIMDKYHEPQVSINRMRQLGLNHILIRSSGYLLFSLVAKRGGLFNLLNKDFREFYRENVPGYKGVYGHLGVNDDLLELLKSHQESDTPREDLESQGKTFVITVEYTGPHYIVNSGRYGGMVIITENFRGINVKTVRS